MVQNVQQVNSTTQKNTGLFSPLSSTITLSAKGAAMGGAVGFLASCLPPSKTLINKEIGDVFLSYAKDEIISENVKNMINTPDKQNVIKSFKNFVNYGDKTNAADIKKLGENAQKSLMNLVDNLPKNDELLVLAKKSAKRINRQNQIKTGALFGMCAILFLNLISGLKPKKQDK